MGDVVWLDNHRNKEAVEETETFSQPEHPIAGEKRRFDFFAPIDQFFDFSWLALTGSHRIEDIDSGN